MLMRMSVAEHEVTDGGEGAPELLTVWLRWLWTATVAWDDLPTTRITVDLSTYHCAPPASAVFLLANKESSERKKSYSSPAAQLGSGWPTQLRARRWMRHAVRPCSSSEAFGLLFRATGAACTQPDGSHGVDSNSRAL